MNDDMKAYFRFVDGLGCECNDTAGKVVSQDTNPNTCIEKAAIKGYRVYSIAPNGTHYRMDRAI